MAEKYLMKGNEALAEAAIRAGCLIYFGYPITPQTELAAYMAKRMPKIGGVFVQAESEIAAINMVYGAAAAGKRVMTSSSSPGVSLKQEGISYLAGSDLPAVIVNVQRGGPGLGGIQPSQSDYFQATKGGGHGDYHLIVLTPASVQEMADLTGLAFDLADKYRVPSMILADGTIGQMMEPVELSEGKSEPVEKPWALTGTQMKRPHNVVNSLYLDPEELEQTNIERFKT
ncbi:MAG: 3-methyl-2-oxobutanoate dehydrogenase subunit beta, partial [Firmicutes bacterium]|nr:3-methyl-2-oxobutanoate dehydrogenase subunit beta [Bacillota bacterium]